MKARKGRHHKVQTFCGYDPTKDISRLLAPNPDTGVDRYTCGHGGYWPDPKGYPYCGICLVGADGTPEESYDRFILMLKKVAQHTVGYLRKYDSLYGHDPEDAVSECLTLLVLNRKNFKAIIEARNPAAMAYKVARLRLMTALSRDKLLKKITLEDDPEGGYTAEEKLANLIDEKNGGGFFDDHIFRIAHFGVLASKENIKRLFQEMENAFALLQKRTPIGSPNIAVAIKLRHGFYGDKPYTERQLVAWVNGTTRRKLTRDQVRYAVEKGEAFIKDHIIKTIFEGVGRGVKAA